MISAFRRMTTIGPNDSSRVVLLFNRYGRFYLFRFRLQRSFLDYLQSKPRFFWLADLSGVFLGFTSPAQFFRDRVEYLRYKLTNRT
jgi:hypothetical protein